MRGVGSVSGGLAINTKPKPGLVTELFVYPVIAIFPAQVGA